MLTIKQKERNTQRISLVRQLALKYLGGICLVCNSEEQLHIHHKNYNWKDNNIKNLVLLCKKHHLMVHSGRIGFISDGTPIVSLIGIFGKQIQIYNDELSYTKKLKADGTPYKHTRDRTHFKKYMCNYMRKRRAQIKEAKGLSNAPI